MYFGRKIKCKLEINGFESWLFHLFKFECLFFNAFEICQCLFFQMITTPMCFGMLFHTI
jgi:hypothetical protein